MVKLEFLGAGIDTSKMPRMWGVVASSIVSVLMSRFGFPILTEFMRSYINPFFTIDMFVNIGLSIAIGSLSGYYVAIAFFVIVAWARLFKW